MPLPRGGEERMRGSRFRDAGPPRPSSPIPTVTVGSGIAPDQPSSGCRRVADSHRRWGIAPRPEDELLSQYTSGWWSGARAKTAGSGRAAVDGVRGAQVALGE